MEANIKILLAEDEPSLGLILKESLETRNFDVVLCKDGLEALLAFKEEKPELLVLDVMMPKKDGFSLAREIRELDEDIPIIFLTAKSQTADVIEGFTLGGNDYLKKPFSMEELIVRIKALLNRAKKTESKKVMELGAFHFYPEKQLLITDGEEITLTHREAQLLYHLILHRNAVLDRSVILKKLWGDDDFFNARSMDVFITKLRKKLKADTSIQIINIRGIGYKLIY